MSWHNFSGYGSRPLKGIAFAAATGLLAVSGAGCGFHPLYTTTASGASMVEAMKAVQVAPIPSRAGQRLRNELIFATTGGGQAATPIYRLDIILRESVRNSLVTTAGNSTGAVLQLDAEFRLVRIKDGETVFKGYSTQEAAYDLNGSTGNAGSIFGDVRANIDAENRAATSLADTLKTRVAAFLSHSA